MSDKRKRPSSIGRFLFNLVTIVPTFFSTIRHIAYMFEYEAHMAGRKIVMLCVLLIFALTVLLSTWLCLLTMIFFYLTSLQLTPQISLLFILIINLLSLIIISLIIMNLKRGILFPETRELIKNVYKR